MLLFRLYAGTYTASCAVTLTSTAPYQEVDSSAGECPSLLAGHCLSAAWIEASLPQ